MIEELVGLISDGYVLKYASIVNTDDKGAIMVLRMKGEYSTEIIPYTDDDIPSISKFIMLHYPSIPIIDKKKY